MSWPGCGPVSEATRRVVLRPLPHRLGPLRVASLYMAAEGEAQIGGDLYAAARVEDSTRMIIGDVRGKGLTSISDASVLMGAFREAAHGSSASRTPDTFAFEDGDTLLLSTDGVIETRAPDGSFYPLAQRTGQWRSSGPEGLPHHLRRDLLDHVGGRLGDDAAMVVIQHSPALHPVQQLKKMVPVNGAHR